MIMNLIYVVVVDAHCNFSPQSLYTSCLFLSLVTSGDRYKIVLAYNVVLHIKHGRDGKKN